MKTAIGILLCVVVFLMVSVTSFAQLPAPSAADPVLTSYEMVKVADGIYAFISPDPTSGFVSGNSVAIVGSNGVLVVDSGHVPSLTRRMISDMARITDKPVRFLVNTHWHPDHVSGNRIYVEQFPGVSIISTPGTLFQLTRPDSLYDDLVQMSKYMPVLEQALASGKGQDGHALSQGERDYYAAILADARYLLPELKQTRPAAPTVIFDRRLTIDLGGRQVEVSFLGRGNTGGDAVVYVPDAKVLMTGDLVVAPTPAAIGSYIDEWVATLKTLAAYDAATIVPGHGPVQHDKQYIALLTQALESLSQQAHAAVKQGQTQEQFQKSVNLAEFRSKMAGSDATRGSNFDEYFVSPGAVRAFREAKDGPLKDED